MPKIIKFPKLFFNFNLIPMHPEFEGVFTDMGLQSKFSNTFDVIGEEQLVDQTNSLAYAEKFLQGQDLSKITPEALEHFIHELHRLTADTVQMVNHMGSPSGNYANYRTLLATTEVDSEAYYPSADDTAIAHNSKLIEKHYGKEAATHYSQCAKKIERHLEKTRQGVLQELTPYPAQNIHEHSIDALMDGLIKKKFNDNLISNAKIEQCIHGELVFDPGYHHVMSTLSMGVAPHKIAGEMLLFCTQLVSMIQQKNPSRSPAEIAAKALELKHLQPFCVANNTVATTLMNVILMHYGIQPIVINHDRSLKAYEQGKLTDYVASVINAPRPFSENDEGMVLNQRNNKIFRLTQGNYIVRNPNVIYLLKFGSNYPDRNPNEMTEFLSLTSEQIEALQKENKIEIMSSDTFSKFGDAIVDANGDFTVQDIADITSNQHDRFAVAGFCFLMAAKLSVSKSDEQADAYYHAAFCYSRTEQLQSAYYYANLSYTIASEKSDTKSKSQAMVQKLDFVKQEMEKQKSQSKEYKDRIAGLLTRYSRPEISTDLNRMLQAAAANNWHQDIHLIIELGAFINYKPSTNQRTALHWAADLAHTESFKELLKFNAKWDIKDYKKETVVDILINSNHEELKAHLETKMLEKYKGTTEKVTPAKNLVLRRAAAFGSLEDVKFLIHRGADVTSKSSNGKTALDWAKENGHTEIINYLSPQAKDKNEEKVSLKTT